MSIGWRSIDTPFHDHALLSQPFLAVCPEPMAHIVIKVAIEEIRVLIGRRMTMPHHSLG